MGWGFSHIPKGPYMFRAAKAVLATTALIIAGIGVASPAHAADVTVTGSNAVPTVSPSSISVSSGSTFTVLNSGSDELAIYATGFTPATIDVAGSACVGVSTCKVAIGATVIFTVTAVGTVGVGGALLRSSPVAVVAHRRQQPPDLHPHLWSSSSVCQPPAPATKPNQKV